MQLTGLEKALEEGCRLHGFRSGGGLRVIRIEQEGRLRGYGEHPNVEDALSHANEDFLAGGREYNEVYGKSKPHYLSGSSRATSPFDQWLLQGRTIDAYRDGMDVVVELRGLVETETPQDIIEQVKETGQPVSWQQRGYTFETSYSNFPNGERCYSTSIVISPKGRSGTGAWMYDIVKIGRAKEFFEALERALEAREIEVSQ